MTHTLANGGFCGASPLRRLTSHAALHPCAVSQSGGRLSCRQRARCGGGGPDNAGGGPPTDPSNRIFVAAVDGSKARELTRLADGSIAGWLDDATLLVRVREGRDSDVSRLITLPLNGSEGREILKGERLR